jgi:hypothetical protein
MLTKIIHHVAAPKVARSVNGFRKTKLWKVKIHRTTGAACHLKQTASGCAEPLVAILAHKTMCTSCALKQKENAVRIKNLLLVLVCFVSAFVVGCINDADTARYNLEREEQNFNVFRRVVFYNGINGEYILTIEGRLAITIDTDGDLVVTVKTENGTYLKHYLGLSDNVTYFSEQLESKAVSTSHYKVIFKPSVIVPVVEVR